MGLERGRDVIERLLKDGELDFVPPSFEAADDLLSHAEAHTALATLGIDSDPSGALQLSYDAARKASSALLAIQGLRATQRGGHIAAIDAVAAQFNGQPGAEVFHRLHRLRRRRNDSEYPNLNSPGVTRSDALEALAIAEATIAFSRTMIDGTGLGPFA